VGWQLAAYRGATRALTPLAAALLRRRLARGKEDPARWREKLGEASAPRPAGRLVWLHAVGLGEVLALRGLIGAMAGEDAGLNFLVTSSARSSAQVMAANLPPRTVHQFLPLDAPRFVARFLAHWRPDLSVWAEQDLWPNAVTMAAVAGVPLALVNARMDATSFARRGRARGLYAEALSHFKLVAAQDEGTAKHLEALGARGAQVNGSLKAAAPPLKADETRLAALRQLLGDRKLWLVASAHFEETALALELPPEDRLLVIVPRDVAHGPGIAERARALGRRVSLQSAGEAPLGEVHVADAYGELGLWYRLAPVTLIGGTFGPVEGHNPWEPAALGSAILHGPRLANFAADFAALDGAGAALPVRKADLPAALAADHATMAARARALSDAAQGSLAPLARDLLALMR